MDNLLLLLYTKVKCREIKYLLMKGTVIMKKEVKQKTRRLSIRNKVLIPVLFIILVICISLGLLSYKIANWAMINTGMEKSLLAASIASSMIDGDNIGQINGDSAGTDLYESELANLREIKETCGILYMYTIYEDGGKLYYGVDTDESETQLQPGDAYDDEEGPVLSALDGKDFTRDYIVSNEYGDLISSYVPIYDSNNKIIAVLGCDYDGSDIKEQLGGVTTICVGCTVGFLLLSIVVVYAFVSKITKNIVIINDKIYELVNHEGDLTQKLNIRSGDELELIGNNVNSLLEYIRAIMINIAGNSVKLKESSEVVSDNIKSAEINITDVSATMEEMAAGMEETSASIVEITDAIHGVYDAINEINEKASVSADKAYTAMEKANEVYEHSILAQSDAKGKTESISQQVAEKIEKSKAVKEIEELTDSILSIAAQTNLLSLNASIEAARAGEAGRGFAVVADEIGKLAQDSASSATRIRQVSTEVIEAVEQLAHVSEDMLSFIDETTMGGFKQLQETSYSYKDDIDLMSSTMQDFTASCQELKANMDSIKDSIEAANIAVDECARGIGNVSEISTNLTASVGDIQEKAEGNKEIADMLNKEVNRFKL